MRATIASLKKTNKSRKKIKKHYLSLNVYTYICSMKIEQAIQQKKFRSEQHKAHINVLYTAAWLSLQMTRMLKPYGITSQQFNILRILKGLYPDPATIKLLTSRMIDKTSNTSRLVDKLLAKGLLDRIECSQDRRRVDIRITDKGLELINTASEKLNLLEEGMFQLEELEATELNRLLDKMRTDE